MLSETQRKALRNLRERYFYDIIFKRIQESDFAVLYSDGGSRPNAPVNCVVGASILQYVNSWSMEQLKVFKVKTNIQRCDSVQIQSNIRSYSRIELLIEVLICIYRVLDEDDRQRFADFFAPYISQSLGQYVYKIDRSELNSELEQLASIYAALKERVNEGYGDISIGHIFERVFEEHFRILDSKLTVKPSSELASSCLQSPDDEDATYRFKRGKAYRGQVLNVTETCNPENEGKLITDVHVSANNRDDSDVLEERIDRILEKTPELVQLHTDGAYGSLENDDKLGARGVEQIQTSIRGQEPKVEISIGVLPNGHY